MFITLQLLFGMGVNLGPSMSEERKMMISEDKFLKSILQINNMV